MEVDHLACNRGRDTSAATPVLNQHANRNRRVIRGSIREEQRVVPEPSIKFVLIVFLVRGKAEHLRRAGLSSDADIRTAGLLPMLPQAVPWRACTASTSASWIASQ
jgi:hypothetical protein